MYGQSVTGKPYFHQLSHSSCLLVIELCFGRNRTDNRFFSVFKVMELKGITWRSFIARVSTNSQGCFVVTFPALHIFCIYQTCMFCNSHEIHFETTSNSLL
jgi:hypothetical protein